MMHSGSGIGQLIRLFCLVATLSFAAGSVHADDYAPVNQLLRDGQLSEAMTKAEQYLAKNPRDPQMRFLKGLIQQDGGQRDAAIQTYTSLIEEYPELPEPYNNLAVVRAAQGKLDQARIALEDAIRAVPGYPVAHENLGDIHAQLAARSYRNAQKLDPTNKTVAPKLKLVSEVTDRVSPEPPRAPAPTRR